MNLSYIRQFDKNTIEMVGFTIASHQTPGVLYVNSLIGLHYRPLQELFYTIKGDDYEKNRYSGTLASPLGYLMPCEDYKEWEFSDQSNIKDVVDDLLYSIRAYGFSFIERYKEPNELLKCLEERKYILEMTRIYKLPIMYYLLGNEDKALEYIKMFSNRCNKNTIDDQKYLEFAEKLKEYMRKH
jgi:hypothetical protein